MMRRVSSVKEGPEMILMRSSGLESLESIRAEREEVESRGTEMGL